MRKIQGEGTYTRKSDGSEVSYSFEYDVLESVKDLPEVELLATANRMLKVDGNNVAREKAKSANGDSTTRLLTPEEKETRKAGRKADSALLKLIKSKGLSEADLADLLK